ncbi:hypothetical protein [Ottowia sp. VDI28]|uniref:hypothetical protein n=1 Tax=Ottowia sp. VDI28 TaxID=3133968 RepID=UPI003C2ACCB9
MNDQEAPSLVSQMVVFEKYGARLDTDQLAELLGQTRGGILNQISAGTFPIPTYHEGKRRFADFRDVAAHLDSLRKQARQNHQQAQGAGLPA